MTPLSPDGREDAADDSSPIAKLPEEAPGQAPPPTAALATCCDGGAAAAPDLLLLESPDRGASEPPQTPSSVMSVLVVERVVEVPIGSPEKKPPQIFEVPADHVAERVIEIPGVRTIEVMQVNSPATVLPKKAVLEGVTTESSKRSPAEDIPFAVEQLEMPSPEPEPAPGKPSPEAWPSGGLPPVALRIEDAASPADGPPTLGFPDGPPTLGGNGVAEGSQLTCPSPSPLHTAQSPEMQSVEASAVPMVASGTVRANTWRPSTAAFASGSGTIAPAAPSPRRALSSAACSCPSDRGSATSATVSVYRRPLTPARLPRTQGASSAPGGYGGPSTPSRPGTPSGPGTPGGPDTPSRPGTPGGLGAPCGNGRHGVVRMSSGPTRPMAGSIAAAPAQPGTPARCRAASAGGVCRSNASPSGISFPGASPLSASPLGASPLGASPLGASPFARRPPQLMSGSPLGFSMLGTQGGASMLHTVR